LRKSTTGTGIVTLRPFSLCRYIMVDENKIIDGSKGAKFQMRCFFQLFKLLNEPQPNPVCSLCCRPSFTGCSIRSSILEELTKLLDCSTVQEDPNASLLKEVTAGAAPCDASSEKGDATKGRFEGVAASKGRKEVVSEKASQDKESGDTTTLTYWENTYLFYGEAKVQTPSLDVEDPKSGGKLLAVVLQSTIFHAQGGFFLISSHLISSHETPHYASFFIYLSRP